MPKITNRMTNGTQQCGYAVLNPTVRVYLRDSCRVAASFRPIVFTYKGRVSASARLLGLFMQLGHYDLVQGRFRVLRIGGVPSSACCIYNAFPYAREHLVDRKMGMGSGSEPL